MKKITFCIPSKSNLRYLKTCIPSIRENASRNNHEIIIFVDSDEDGTVEWLEQVKDEYNLRYFVNPNLGKSLFGIGKAYDYCVEQSTTDIFMIFHADMMLGKDADLKAFEHLKPQTVVCATRIEPPLHPNGGEKILLDFGMWPEEFKKGEFNQYVEQHLEDDKITNGIFAPWMMYKADFVALGGHDPILHSCREDSDVFNRMKLAGYKFIQPWNSLVYHLTGRGAGSFDGDPERHAKWLEPWCDRIYIEDDMQVIISNYIEKEQQNTSFDLTKRVFHIRNNDPIGENDIVVEFDAHRLTQQNFPLLHQLPEIINNSGEIGEFELDIFKIIISYLEDFCELKGLSLSDFLNIFRVKEI